MTTLELHALIQELAALPPLEYDLKRKAAAKETGVRLRTLDAEVKKFRAQPGRSNSFEHSNTDTDSSTQTGTSGSSNEGSSLEQLLEAARPLLEAHDPLEPVRKALIASGYAGDTRPAELAYLALCSRLLQRPMNLHFLAPSAAGKNHAVDSALYFHPAEAYYKLSASSPRALIYTSQRFQHRTVVLAEMDSIPAEGPAAAAIRSIANDGCMSYETVEKDHERLVTRTITKEGPTGFITTGTRPLDD